MWNGGGDPACQPVVGGNKMGMEHCKLMEKERNREGAFMSVNARRCWWRNGLKCQLHQHEWAHLHTTLSAHLLHSWLFLWKRLQLTTAAQALKPQIGNKTLQDLHYLLVELFSRWTVLSQKLCNKIFYTHKHSSVVFLVQRQLGNSRECIQALGFAFCTPLAISCAMKVSGGCCLPNHSCFCLGLLATVMLQQNKMVVESFMSLPPAGPASVKVSVPLDFHLPPKIGWIHHNCSCPGIQSPLTIQAPLPSPI